MNYVSVEATKTQNKGELTAYIVAAKDVIEISNNEFSRLANVTIDDGFNSNLATAIQFMKIADSEFNDDLTYSTLKVRQLSQIANVNEAVLVIAEDEKRAARLGRCFNIDSIKLGTFEFNGSKFKGLMNSQL